MSAIEFVEMREDGPVPDDGGRDVSQLLAGSQRWKAAVSLRGGNAGCVQVYYHSLPQRGGAARQITYYPQAED